MQGHEIFNIIMSIDQMRLTRKGSMMQKLLIVVPSQKPVPAVKNGAIEVRVEILLKYNEMHPMFDITVASIYDKDAVKQSKKYQHAKFWFIKTRKWEKKVYLAVKTLLGKLSSNRLGLPKELYHQKFFNKLCHHRKEFDKILIENIVPLVEKTKEISKTAVYLHLGSDGLNEKTPRAGEIAGNLEKILVVSDYIGSIVKRIPGVIPEKVVKINQGIEQDIFTRKPVHNRNELQQLLGINPDDVVYEFHGRVTPNKGVRELISAFARLKYENVKLIILGTKSSWTKSDAYLEELNSLVQKLGEKVIFTGEIPHDRIGEYLNAADIAVLPSIWEEPAGQAILESMIAGLPLITTKSGGLIEYCDPDASYVLPRDSNLVDNIAAAMEDLYLHPEKRAEMGRIAKEFGKKFTAERHAEEVFTTLQS